MPPVGDTLLHASPVLTTNEKRVLSRIFQHPLSHNLSWRDTMSLIHAIGTVEQAHNGDTVLTIGSEHQSFKLAHDKDLATQDVMALRHLLLRAGWAPGASPVIPDIETSADLIAVIDHAGTRVYSSGPQQASAHHELHHLLHHIERKQHDADRDEAFPSDTTYFDDVAQSLAGGGRIVVIGHGKGQSNEAEHLMAYLTKHHSGVQTRVVREIMADIAHLTVPQLVELARLALLLPPTTTISHADKVPTEAR